MVGRVLQTDIPLPKSVTVHFDEVKVSTCMDYILEFIQVPNLTYDKRDVVARAVNGGFSIREVEEALNRLVQKNLLRYSKVTEGYSVR